MAAADSPGYVGSPPHDASQLLRLQVESQKLLGYLDYIEALWIRLQKRSSPDLLPVDLLGILSTEIASLFPAVLSAIYLANSETHEFTIERCVPEGLREDCEREVQKLIATGHFAQALRRNRPTICQPLVLHRYHPRARSVLLVPLVTLQAVRGMVLIGVERAEADISPPELKLLSIFAGQTSLALESARREATLRQQNTSLER